MVSVFVRMYSWFFCRKKQTSLIIKPCYIEPGAKIGEYCLIGPFVVIAGCVKIGDKCEIGPGTVIGTPPQHVHRKSRYGDVVIGNHVIIRDHVDITAALEPGDHTIVEDECYIMSNTNINHDCHIEPGAILSSPLLAGFVHVMKTANIGLGAVVHQFTTIGTGAMIGMGSVVVKDIPPYAKVAGNPAEYLEENTFLSSKVSEAYIESENARFESLRNEKRKGRLLDKMKKSLRKYSS